eukprot:scaffold104738_cov33-Tisochrysis_lutea.AAC.4
MGLGVRDRELLEVGVGDVRWTSDGDARISASVASVALRASPSRTTRKGARGESEPDPNDARPLGEFDCASRLDAALADHGRSKASGASCTLASLMRRMRKHSRKDVCDFAHIASSTCTQPTLALWPDAWGDGRATTYMSPSTSVAVSAVVASGKSPDWYGHSQEMVSWPCSEKEAAPANLGNTASCSRGLPSRSSSRSTLVPVAPRSSAPPKTSTSPLLKATATAFERGEGRGPPIRGLDHEHIPEPDVSRVSTYRSLYIGAGFSDVPKPLSEPRPPKMITRAEDLELEAYARDALGSSRAMNAAVWPARGDGGFPDG